MLAKFRYGDYVRVIEVDEYDKQRKVCVGDIFIVKQDDDPAPYCEPVDSACKEGYALAESQLELTREVKIKFNIGDIVEVVQVQHPDKSVGIEVGDIFKVIERDTVPYCTTIQSDYDGNIYAFEQCQLELYEGGK